MLIPVRILLSFSLFSFLLITNLASAAPVPFQGNLGFVEVDNGTGIYSNTPLGTNFSGVIDDSNFNGFITDGTTQTNFGCCIAAGGLEISNDMALSADDAAFLNSLLGINKYKENDVVDGVDIEGDVATQGSGRIEIGLSYLFDASTFSNEDLSNYPFDQTKVEVALFFILEEDQFGTDIYSAGGLISAVPIPAAAWLFGTGLIALLGVQHRKGRVS